MKVLKRLLKITLYTLISVIGSFILLIGVLNGVKFIIYDDYYSIKEDLCTNPGLNDGAVPQGIAVSEDEDLVLTTAYMTDHSQSRLYVTNSRNEAKCLLLTYKNEPFYGHVGGISLDGNDAYISDEKKLYHLNLLDIKAKANKDSIDIGEGISVNNQASFTYAHDGFLYVGEFHYGPYQCENIIGNNHAICTKYSLSDLTKPLEIYSIRDKVQGFCVTDRGDIVLSTSWSVNDSVLYVYNKENIKKTGEYQGVDLYELTTEDRKILAPAMTEDLSYANGRVYTLFESACNKYLFGKLFGAFEIASLAI